MVMGNVHWRRSTGSPRPLLVLLAGVVIAAMGCGSSPKHEDPADVRRDVDAVNKQFMEAFARRDAAALGLLYTEDAQVLPPGSPMLEGREAIVNMWQSMLALPIAGIQLETADLGTGEASAWEVGRYRLTRNDGTTAEAGKYIVIWRHDESGWKIYRDMWSSDTPAAAPATGGAPTP